jgi:type VI protein secretion system component VasK
VGRPFIIELLFAKWLWIIILSCIAIVVFPLFIVWMIFLLPHPLNAIAVWLTIFGWGIAAGIKDWQIHKHKEEDPLKEFRKNKRI